MMISRAMAVTWIDIKSETLVKQITESRIEVMYRHEVAFKHWPWPNTVSIDHLLYDFIQEHGMENSKDEKGISFIRKYE